jgi:CBS-domain-containing membrane protein
VRDAMSSGNLVCIRAEDDIDNVEKLMGRNQVRRIPVVDDQNRVLGVIAQADLARERKAIGEKDLGKVLEKISEPAGVR